MAKRPPLPFHLVENLYDEEDAIIAAFTRVVIRMIGRGIIERPEEAYIKKMACLDSKDWDKHQTRLKTLLESFYGPFLEHWKHYSHKRVENQKKARSSVNKWNRLNEMLKRHVTNVNELKIRDAAAEFSSQPVMLERTKQQVLAAPNIVASKPAPLKGALKEKPPEEVK